MSWLRALAYMLMPNPLIIARIAPSMTPITSSAWFSVHSSAASAAGASAGIGVCSAPVARTKIHSAATTMPIATTTSVAIRSRISPGSVESSQSSHARQRLFCCGAGRSSWGSAAERCIESAVTGGPKNESPSVISLPYEVFSDQAGSGGRSGPALSRQQVVDFVGQLAQLGDIERPVRAQRLDHHVVRARVEVGPDGRPAAAPVGMTVFTSRSLPPSAMSASVNP